jgi:O-methyltransferase involved in polyketide biosynthesis
MIEAQPSKTALRVALRRAAHQLHDAKPLVFEDPLAVRILGPAARELRAPDAASKPYSAAIRAFMVARARLAEDVLADGVHQHDVRQYLVLGAGLDTFAYRNPYAGVRVFEVDHPVDFERQSLQQELAAAGFDFSLPTVTAWLGVTPYLTSAAFRATASLLGSFAAGSSVVFDYSQPREALAPNEQLMLDSLAARVAQAGEPFQLFFRPQELRTELKLAGLDVVEDLDGPAITLRYFQGRKDGLKLRGSGGRICWAQSQPRAQ